MSEAPPFSRVEVDEDVAGEAFTREFLDRLPGGFDVRTRPAGVPAPHGRDLVHLTREPGEFLKPCPCSPGAVRCGYWVFTPAFQCPFRCSYCFLRFYAPEVPVTLYANLTDAAAELKRAARGWQVPTRFGTGQFADSLALDPWTRHADWLLDQAAELPRGIFELKTKSARVDALLGRAPPPNVVVSWSVNPPDRIHSDEPGTATLAARLGAAAAVAKAGYRVGFHFDPIFAEEGWEKAYASLAQELFSCVAPERVAWISLGTLRFPSRFLDRWGPSLSGNRSFFGEFLPGEDGKLRYFWPVRKAVYCHLERQLTRSAGRELPIYMCMESASTWSAALGWAPAEGELERFLGAAEVSGRIS